MENALYHKGLAAAAWVSLGGLALMAAAPIPHLQPTPDLRYTVQVDHNLNHAQVELCADEALTGTLSPTEDYCRPYASVAEVQMTAGAWQPLLVQRGGFMMPPGAGRCLRMQVDLAKAATRDGKGRTAQRSGESLILSPDLVLWPPAGVGDSDRVEVRFELPAGMSVSTPWPKSKEGVYVMPVNSWRRQTRLAVGKLAQEEISVAGARLNIALLDGYGGMSPDLVRQWIRSAAEAVSLITGEFPRERVQVLVQPVKTRWGPVPFGKSIRGGGAAIHLYVGVNAQLADLKRDWVAVHEMSHLLHPFTNFDDAWFSEGLATYYQEVALARGGHQTEAEAWDALMAGFGRGRSQTRGHKTLIEVAADLKKNRRYMQVYWSGAAFAFLADVRLRSRGDGWSLDRALHLLKPRFGNDDRMLRSREIAAEIDNLVGPDAGILALHNAIAQSTAFPDVGPAIRALGLTRGPSGVSVDEAASQAAIRRAIMAPLAPR